MAESAREKRKRAAAAKRHLKIIRERNKAALQNPPMCRVHVGRQMTAFMARQYKAEGGRPSRDALVFFRCPIVLNGRRCEQVAGTTE